MNTLPQLKQMREQMIEELTQLPQYRAMKAMERFISEMTKIYEGGGDHQDQELGKQMADAIERRIELGPVSAGATKVTTYVAPHRVA